MSCHCIASQNFTIVSDEKVSPLAGEETAETKQTSGNNVKLFGLAS